MSMFIIVFYLTLLFKINFIYYLSWYKYIYILDLFIAAIFYILNCSCCCCMDHIYLLFNGLLLGFIIMLGIVVFGLLFNGIKLWLFGFKWFIILLDIITDLFRIIILNQIKYKNCL